MRAPDKLQTLPRRSPTAKINPSPRLQQLTAKPPNPDIRNDLPMVYPAIENGRCAHGSGPMTKILRRIHRRPGSSFSTETRGGFYEDRLVVDDDGMLVKNVSEILAEGGFRSAADGAEALRILEREHTSIDAVIVDLNLSQVSGFEVIGALTRHSHCRSSRRRDLILTGGSMP
jgi:hypothetical protein